MGYFVVAANLTINFSYIRDQVYLWLSNGQILKKKGKLEGLRKLNLKLLMCQMLIHNILHCLELCQWVMFLHITDMAIR